MDLYNIKIGNMYITSIYLNKDYATNNFIEDIEFSVDKDCAYKIYGSEIDKYNKILKEIFHLEDDSMIKFEKIESEEN